MTEFSDRYTYNTQAPKANWQQNQRNAFLAGNPNIGASGSDQYGNPLSKEGQGGLMGYEVIDKTPFANAWDDGGNITGYGTTANGQQFHRPDYAEGYAPRYGSKSVNVTPELRSPNQYRDYLKSNAYNVLESQKYIIAKNKAKHKAFKKKLFLGTAAAFALPIGLAVAGGGIAAAAGGGSTGISTGAATAGASAGTTAAGSGGLAFAKGAALKSALTGGLSGYMQGGDFKSALKGAAIGGITGGYAPAISQGLGLTGKAASSLSGAITGVGQGYAGGGGKGALLGALTGGVGGYLGGTAGTASNPEDFGYAGGSSGGNFSSSGGLPPTPSIKPSQLGSTVSKGLGMLKDYASPLGTALSGYRDYKAVGDQEDDLKEAQDMALREFRPYKQAGLEANTRLRNELSSGGIGGDFNFQQDPGYQYQLEQGEQALGRMQSSRGNRFSGRALKEALMHSQGLADQSYGQSYHRDQNRQQQLYNMLAGQQAVGAGAAGRFTDAYTNIGNISAAGTSARNNSFNQTLSELLRGYGAGEYG